MSTIINNLYVHYQSSGRGAIILCLHGWGDNLTSFTLLAEAMAEDYSLVCLDLPGFGKSQQPNEVWGVSDYAEFVADFIKKLNLEIYGLVGHSFGGRISISGVANGILSPKRLVLIATSGIKKSQTTKSQLFKVTAKIGKIVMAIPPLNRHTDKIKRRLYQAAGSTDYLNAGAMKQTFRKVIDEDLRPEAAKIKVPTLIIWGADDRETPLKDGKEFESIIPGSKLVVIDQAGHFVHQERTQEVATAMEGFLK